MPAKSGRLPPVLITAWSKLKKDLVPAVDKLPKDLVDDDQKKKIKKGLSDMFAKLDGGLKKKMILASEAEDDAVAKKALADVSKICKDYKKKVKAAVTEVVKDDVDEWKELTANTNAIAKKVSETLKAIDSAAAKTLAAMP